MSLSAAILRNDHELQNLSSKLYADRLAQGLQSTPVRVLDVPPPPIPNLLGIRPLQKAERYLARYCSHPRTLRRIRADLYHIVDHANAHWIRDLPPERTVVTCHDLLLYKCAIGEIPYPPMRPWIAASFFRWSTQHLPRAAAVICVSENTRNDVLQFLGCQLSRVHVVHHGIDEVFRPIPLSENKRGAERKRLGLSWPITILHVGASSFYKNVEALLKALALLPRDWQDRVHLVKAGDPFLPSHLRLIRRHRLEDRVHSLSTVTAETLVLLYNLSDILVYPSLHEGFGWPPLEAMACGLPVVCSDRGALAETAGDAACFINPEDPVDILRGILRVLEDTPYRNELIRRGLQRAACFRWEDAIQKTVAVYRSVNAFGGS